MWEWMGWRLKKMGDIEDGEEPDFDGGGTMESGR